MSGKAQSKKMANLITQITHRATDFLYTPAMVNESGSFIICCNDVGSMIIDPLACPRDTRIKEV